MDAIEQSFSLLLSGYGIEINEKQLKQFHIYYEELISWNEKMNLTAITEREAVYIKHFFDSASLSFFVPFRDISSMVDIGSGAGFPGLPLKILFPHIKLTIIDSLNKRIQFLKYLSEQLGFNDVSCIHGRAEELGRSNEHRDTYDIASARAVAKLNVLNEFCLPFVKKDGYFAAMKGSNPDEEVRQADNSFQLLKARIIDVIRFELPIENADRHIILIRKTDGTPSKFPRKPGVPLKSPLL